jgi:hypothetical protein
MVPFWAYMYWLQLCPRVRSHTCPEEVVYSLNDSHPTSFPSKCSSPTCTVVNILLLYTTVARIHIIHHIHTYIHILILYYTTHSCAPHIFISSALRGRLAALGSLCPIHVPPFLIKSNYNLNFNFNRSSLFKFRIRFCPPLPTSIEEMVQLPGNKRPSGNLQ